jgi:Flp pilus assembly protein TadG
MARTRKSQAASNRDGTVAIEYGLILPMLLLLTFGIIETGRFFWTYITLNRAADAAARYGAVCNSASEPCTAIPTYAKQQAWGMSGIPAGTFTVTNPANCGQAAANGVRVVASYPYNFFMPWFNPNTTLGVANAFTITATACYPKQF